MARCYRDPANTLLLGLHALEPSQRVDQGPEVAVAGRQAWSSGHGQSVGARAQGWGGFDTGKGVAIVQGARGLVLALDLLALATVAALRFSLGYHEA